MSRLAVAAIDLLAGSVPWGSASLIQALRDGRTLVCREVPWLDYEGRIGLEVRESIDGWIWVKPPNGVWALDPLLEAEFLFSPDGPWASCTWEILGS